MSTIVTVFSKPACVQCTATKRVLDRATRQYQAVDITESADAYELVKGLGYQQVPVVHLVGGTVADRGGEQISHWSGFRPDLLAQL